MSEITPQKVLERSKKIAERMKADSSVDLVPQQHYVVIDQDTLECLQRIESEIRAQKEHLRLIASALGRIEARVPRT